MGRFVGLSFQRRESVIVETFRMLFDLTPGGHGGWRRALDWTLTVALIAVGVALVRDATAGREYPWGQGKVFWGAVLLWLATMRGRSGLQILFAGRTQNDLLGFGARWLNRIVIIALCWFPGMAVGWYSIEADNNPSRNSRGTDVCDVSSAQICVSGPRALIPWAILLLAFAGFATYYFIWSWTKAKRRDRERPAPLAEAARRGLEAVIPPNDPDASTFDDQPVPQARPTDKDLSQGMADLSALVKMKQDGAITPAEFDRLKAEIIGRATDGV